MHQILGVHLVREPIQQVQNFLFFHRCPLPAPSTGASRPFQSPLVAVGCSVCQPGSVESTSTRCLPFIISLTPATTCLGSNGSPSYLRMCPWTLIPVSARR